MKLFRFVSMSCIIALCLTACGSAAPTVSQRPPLKVAWLVFPGYYPLLIAQEKGLFEKHGIQVEMVQKDTTPAEMMAIAEHAADCALVVFTDVVPVAERNDLRIVNIVDTTNGGDQLLASADIPTITGLKGKRIGARFGSYSELFVREILKKNGLGVSDVKLVDVPPEALVQELGKTVDAGHTYEPFASQAHSIGYKTIASTADVPNLIFDVLVCRGSVVKERPEDIRAFNAAWFEGLEWWQANPSEGNTLVAELTSQKPEDISSDGIKLFTLDDNLYSFDAKNPESIFVAAQKTVDFYLLIGSLSLTPDLNKLLDPSYLK